MKYVFAIDPGTGSTSPAAVAFYDAQSKEVLWSCDIWPLGYKKRGNTIQTITRIQLIVKQLEKLWKETIAKYPINQIGIAIENFVMQGKGGATLQMFRGGALCVFEKEQKVSEVGNTSMKKGAGGHGGASKEEVADGLIKRIPKSAEYIKELKDLKAWDQIDAIGIAFCAEFR